MALAGGVPSIHPYSGSDDNLTESAPYSTISGQANFSDIALIRNVMVTAGRSNDPLWATEFGWSSGLLGASTQAQDVMQSLEMLKDLYPYVSVGAYFDDIDNPGQPAPFNTMGLYDDTPTEKLAARAFNEFNELWVDPAVLSVPTSTLNFSGTQGSATTSFQSIVVTNTGSAFTTLNWSATSTQPWLTFSPASGSLAGGVSSSISLIANQSGLGVGTYNATATIQDSNASGSPQYLPVSFTISSTGISAVILSPTGGSTVTSTITISGSATSTAGITQVQFLLDGSPLGTVTSTPYQFSWNTTQASNGTHAISVLATDTYNNSASSSISVTVANVATSTTPSPVVEVAAGGGGGTGYTPAPVTTTSTPPAATSTTISSISTSSLQAELTMLLAELQVLEAKASTTSSSSPYAFTRNLTIGSKGSDVKTLQHYLNTHGFTVVTTPTYAGSLGYETQYFGKATQAALAGFQKKAGITPAVGFFGPITRAYVNGQ